MKNGPGKLFSVFAILIVVTMVLGTVAVFGGGVIGSNEPASPDETVQPNEDVTRLETQVAENPDDTGAAGVLADIYANQGRYSEAIPLFEKAVSANPDDGSLRLAFGLALYRSGNYFDARIQLKKAYELGPHVAEAAYYLGSLNESGDDPDMELAKSWYHKAIEHDPESTIAEQAQKRLNNINGTGTATPEAP